MDVRFSIVTKVSLLVLTAILSTLIVGFTFAFFSLSGMKQTNHEELEQIIYEERKNKLVELTENAHTVLNESTSLAEGLKAIGAMRFGAAKKNYFFAVDEKGRYLLHPVERKLWPEDTLTIKSLDNKYIVREMLDGAKKNGRGFISYLWENPLTGKEDTKLTCYQYVPKYELIIATGIYNNDIRDIARAREAELLIKLEKGINIFILAVLFFTACFTLASIVFLRKMLSPLGELAAFAENLGEGNLATELKHRGSDELGVMASAMRRGARDLGEVIRHLTKVSETVADSASRVFEIAGHLNGTSNELAAHSANATQETHKISGHMKNILEATNTINERLDKISGFTEAVSGNTADVGEKIDSVSRSTTSAACAIEQMYASFNETAQNSSKGAAVTEKASRQAEKTSAIMAQLGESAKEIGEIIEIIQTIAAQTHLLSLNAAIEAAGAGDAGKGFFVVANEVKELANQTESSAKVIREKILGMQERTQKAVEVNGKIVRVIADIDQVMLSIASSVEEQTSVTNDISSNISVTAENAGDLNNKAKENIEAVNHVALNIEASSNESDLIKRDVKITTTGIEGVLMSMSETNESVKTSALGIEEIQSRAGELENLARDLRNAAKLFVI